MKQTAIGFLGGSFDPIHNGHLFPAIESAQKLQLQQLFLLPNHIAPHKNRSHCTTDQRVEMVKLAIQDIPELYIDTRELNRDSASYTVETLKEIRSQYPTVPICFIMGMDSLINFDSWYQWHDILNYCHLVICARPGWKSEFNNTIQTLLNNHRTDSINELHQLTSGKIYFQDTTQLDISSTQIRNNIKHHLSVEKLIPIQVNAFIKENQLYG